MFTLPLNSHYFHLSCLLTKAVSFFYAFFIKAPLKHPWKQSPPSGEEKGCREPKKGLPQSCSLHSPSLLLAPLSPPSFLSVSLCLSFSREGDLLLPDPSALIQRGGAELIQLIPLLREAPVKSTKLLGFLGEANTWEKSINAGIFSIFRKLFLLAAVQH